MIRKYKKNSKIKIFSILIVILLFDFQFKNLALAANSEENSADKLSEDPALFVFHSQSPGPNEFPATIGTVGDDDSGFSIEWEDGNLSDFLRQLQESLNIDLESIDFFGLSGDGAGEIDPHDYHNSHRHLNESEYDDASNRKEFNKSNNQDIAYNSSNNLDTSASTNTNANTDTQEEDDDDWRKSRKWWQRGTPVL